MIPDNEVQELLDRSRIGDTIYAYCDYADQADVDAIVGLFAHDGQIDLGGGAIHRGHAEMREMFIDRFTLYTVTSFYCSGIRLAHYDGHTATTTTHLQSFHESAGQRRQMHLWGRFDDELVKESGVWKFTMRHLRVAGISHAPASEVPRRFNGIDRAPIPQK